MWQGLGGVSGGVEKSTKFRHVVPMWKPGSEACASNCSAGPGLGRKAAKGSQGPMASQPSQNGEL